MRASLFSCRRVQVGRRSDAVAGCRLDGGGCERLRRVQVRMIGAMQYFANLGNIPNIVLNGTRPGIRAQKMQNFNENTGQVMVLRQIVANSTVPHLQPELPTLHGLVDMRRFKANCLKRLRPPRFFSKRT